MWGTTSSATCTHGMNGRRRPRLRLTTSMIAGMQVRGKLSCKTPKHPLTGRQLACHDRPALVRRAISRDGLPGGVLSPERERRVQPRGFLQLHAPPPCFPRPRPLLASWPAPRAAPPPSNHHWRRRLGADEERGWTRKEREPEAWGASRWRGPVDPEVGRISSRRSSFLLAVFASSFLWAL